MGHIMATKNVFFDITIGGKPAGRIVRPSEATLSQRPLKTSALSAPEKKDSATKALPSTELSLVSCAKEVTSPTTTELAVNPSMEPNSLMKTQIEAHWTWNPLHGQRWSWN